MGRIRNVKPEFWSNESLSAVSLEAHALACALLNYADDEGYFNARSELVKAACFPIRSTKPIPVLLRELDGIGYVELRENREAGKTIGHIVKFLEHQYINKANPSKLKTCFDSVTTTGTVSEDSGSATVGLPVGREGKPLGKPLGKGSGRFTKPTLEEVQDYVTEKRHHFDPERFWNHYEANGWMVGKNPMKDWRAACANWEKNEPSRQVQAPRNGSSAPVLAAMPSGDLRIPGGFRAADGSWFDYRGERYFRAHPGKPYRTKEGYRVDGSSVQTDPRVSYEDIARMEAAIISGEQS